MILVPYFYKVRDNSSWRFDMATNPPKGDGHRNGAVKDRTQVHNPQNDRWVKRDSDSGRFMDVKADSGKFKGVTKEKPSK
jgi:hypothetical protein